VTVKELSEACGFTPVVMGKGTDLEVLGVYACDLLSWVIGRATENSALVTVMTNVNVIAVAAMADLSCVILTEGVKLDANALEKAEQNGIPVLVSDKTTYETCALLSKVLG
jgi:predicted transcriptional regulator